VPSADTNMSATSNQIVEDAVSMTISERGKKLAGQLEPFEDTYNTVRTLLSGVGTSQIIDGSFIDVLANNYKNQVKNTKEISINATDYEKQIKFLDKAFDQAALSVAAEYTKQMQILTGDIVINTKLKSYSSKQAAENALKADDAKAVNSVIGSEANDKITSDIKNFCLQAKDSLLKYDMINVNSSNSSTFTFLDIKKIGRYLLDKKHQGDVSDISDFANTILTVAKNLRTSNKSW
jgi:hypothetical protein